MEVCRRSSWLLPLLGVILLAQALQGVQGEAEVGPSESECRPYIEKALRNLETVDAGEADVGQSQEQTFSTLENSIDDAKSDEEESTKLDDNNIETQESHEESEKSTEEKIEEVIETETNVVDASVGEEESQNEKIQEDSLETLEIQSAEEPPEKSTVEESAEKPLEDDSKDINDTTAENISTESIEETQSIEEPQEQPIEPSVESTSTETQEELPDTQEFIQDSSLESEEQPTENVPLAPSPTSDEASTESGKKEEDVASEETVADIDESMQDASTPEENAQDENTEDESVQHETNENENIEESSQGSTDATSGEIIQEEAQSIEETVRESSEEISRSERSVDVAEDEVLQQIEDAEEDNGSVAKDSEEEAKTTEEEPQETSAQSSEKSNENVEEQKSDSNENQEKIEDAASSQEISPDNQETRSDFNESRETLSDEKEVDEQNEPEDKKVDNEESAEVSSDTNSVEDAPEEELINMIDIPENLRPREHVEQLLKLDREATKSEEIIDRISEITLRELKRLYENAIKPLETLYKYRDLSNRHYGDSEIFSKPLILFMGPWSGGKSSIINYLLDIEYNDTSLRTGAEPSPAYFNLLMYGDEEEVLDGTQLAADYTFSGLQKFGQGLEERLRGLKLQSKLLEKVNIVEIPGILEVRKQVSRVFPFNDACQWFIDRADIIFLVYDPSKLDVGPETEAILDQLKGREYQTRIVLNKADQVKPEELMRVQGALIWNISPLMSSPQPPVMYTTSLWSRPYEHWAPIRLLQSQERAFLRDLRSAIDRRIENKIASARRFAVRVRNHAKMVDCYLTTYYNHKSIFGNRKLVSDAIIEHPQDYHIYEGLSTLTNISRYDLPDPDVYKDFFRLNPLYEFQQLSATCTYFRGCPINKLDVAIAYDLPELVGKHKRMVESALAESNKEQQPQGS